MSAILAWRRRVDARGRPGLPPAVLVLVAYLLVGVAFEPSFVGWTNLTSMLISTAALVPAVTGMQLLLILGRFDLSAGAAAALAGMVAGVVCNWSGSLALGLASGVAAGAASGLITGFAVGRLKVDPLVATLAIMGIGRSLALVVNGSEIVTGLPDRLSWLANGEILGTPVLLSLGLAFVALSAFATRHLVIFRRFYAVGNNERAASHAGVDAGGLLVFGYVVSGVGFAATGLVQVSRTLSASPLTFQTLPIDLITACILGGGSLAGGRGSVLGAVVGLFAVVATDNLVVILGLANDWKDFAVGSLLLVIVTWHPALKTLRTAWAKTTILT